VDVLKPDFVDYAITQWPTQAVLPHGYSSKVFPRAVARKYKQTVSSNDIAHGAPAILETVGSLRRHFESVTQCVWMEEWLRLDATGEPTAASHAAEVLSESATWPATVATDGGGVVDSLKRVASAAKAGVRAPVQEEVDVNCADYTTYEGARR
jgi:hypothetical protein